MTPEAWTATVKLLGYKLEWAGITIGGSVVHRVIDPNGHVLFTTQFTYESPGLVEHIRANYGIHRDYQDYHYEEDKDESTKMDMRTPT